MNSIIRDYTVRRIPDWFSTCRQICLLKSRIWLYLHYQMQSCPWRISSFRLKGGVWMRATVYESPVSTVLNYSWIAFHPKKVVHLAVPLGSSQIWCSAKALCAALRVLIIIAEWIPLTSAVTQCLTVWDIS